MSIDAPIPEELISYATKTVEHWRQRVEQCEHDLKAAREQHDRFLRVMLWLRPPAEEIPDEVKQQAVDRGWYRPKEARARAGGNRESDR